MSITSTPPPKHRLRHVLSLATLSLLLSPALALSAPVTFSAEGSDPASIQGQVDAYRSDLGTLNANVAGSFGSGRREINWDGVPDAMSAPNALPGNFFNVNSPRGAVFTTPGSGFEVSSTAASGVPVRFGNINPTYTNEFQTFSPPRLFTPIGSNLSDLNFFVPGSTTAALSRGLGVVFTDVNQADSTSLTFFDSANKSLGTFFAPVDPAGGLSFLGVDFGSDVVSRVTVQSGNAALGPTQTGNLDLVVMDDFIFGEPVAAAAVPEPGTLALLALGLLGLCAVARRRAI